MSDFTQPIVPLNGLGDRALLDRLDTGEASHSALVSVDAVALRQTVWNGTSKIDIWWADLDSVNLSEAFLNAAERERAKRFIVSSARRQFVAARAALRLSLGGYLGCDATAVDLVVGQHGKPELADRRLTFNLAHSLNRAVIAVTSHDSLGVDCEFMASLDAVYSACQLVLSKTECDIVANCPGADQRALLYRIWTRKEAVAKATGLGLGLPWRDFSVLTSASSQAPDVVDVQGHGAFRILDLDKPMGFAASLAVRSASL